MSLGHNYIGTEHILLGVVRENEGVAARILLDFGADAEKIRNEVIGMLAGTGGIAQSVAAEPLTSPPLAPELLEELERVRRDKEAAIEAQKFEEAAKLRHRQRRLQSAGVRLQRAWEGRDEPPVPPRPMAVRQPVARALATPRFVSPEMLYVAAIVGASIFGVGLLIGWLIWG
jgi:hypothetical protein